MTYSNEDNILYKCTMTIVEYRLYSVQCTYIQHCTKLIGHEFLYIERRTQGNKTHQIKQTRITSDDNFKTMHVGIKYFTCSLMLIITYLIQLEERRAKVNQREENRIMFQ